MSVENLKSLISIITDFYKDKHDIDINDIDINIKKIFFNIMKRISSDNEHEGKNATEKTKLALKIVKEIIKHELISKDTKNTRQLAEKSVIDVQTNKQITPNTDVFDKMSVIAESIRKENIPVETMSLKSSQIGDKSICEDEFKNNMKELENNRESFSKSIKEMFPPLENNNSIEKRNIDMSDLVNRSVNEIDPKEFYIKNDILRLDNQSAVIDNISIKAGDRSLGIPNTPPSGRILVKGYILINSYNRNWVVERLRYKYRVIFGGIVCSSKTRVPVYTNHKTIPGTQTATYAGVPNTAGWSDNNGNVYDKYEPSYTGTNGVVGFEEFEIPAILNATTTNVFNDIYSIMITNITIPIERINQRVNNTVNANVLDSFTNFNYNYNFPYILCNIDEFSDIYDGTDRNVRKSFCQLQYSDFIMTPNGRGYIIFKPVQNEKKIFYPIHLTTLPTLNISLRKPNGELLDDSEDGMVIKNICTENNYYIRIETDKYFSKDAYAKGDYIKIRDFTIFELAGFEDEYTQLELSNLIKFINKEEGHVVHEVSEPADVAVCSGISDHGYYKSFIIEAQGSLNEETGMWVTMCRQQKLLEEFSEQLHLIGAYPTSFSFGNVLNMSLQHSISMTVEMYKHDAGVLNTIIVTKSVI